LKINEAFQTFSFACDVFCHGRLNFINSLPHQIKAVVASETVLKRIRLFCVPRFCIVVNTSALPIRLHETIFVNDSRHNVNAHFQKTFVTTMKRGASKK
jgi:hypothetical protein